MSEKEQNEEPDDVRTAAPEEVAEGDRPTLEEGKKKKGLRVSVLDCVVVGGVVLVLGATLVPNFIRARARGHLTSCKSNLKNLGTAMEMYSTDWSGNYPPEPVKQYLTPNYLKTIPECSAAGYDSYVFEIGKTATYNTQSYDNYYFIRCVGDHHETVSVPENYPQYNGIIGLIER